MKPHVMIDIECVGKLPTGAVVAIGARLFTKDEILGGFEIYIDPENAVRYGTRDASTMDWWSRQDFNVRQQVMSGRIDLPTALKRFADWCKLHDVECCWAYPPQFDFALLQHAYAETRLEWPFHYRQERCARTVKALGRDLLGVDFEGCYDNLNNHLPLDDATAQAKVIQRVMQKLEQLQAAGSKKPLRKPKPASSTTPEADLASTLASLEGQGS